jgi:hypothetical protein
LLDDRIRRLACRRNVLPVRNGIVLVLVSE